MKYELPSTELIVIEENNYLKFGEYLNDMQCDDTANKLILDDLEYVKKLQQENKILKENAENNDKVVDKVNWENQLLKKENQQLKEKLDCDLQWAFKYEKQVDNWNKLKEFIKSQNDGGIFSDLMIISDVLNKMQELEQGSDSK